MLLTENNVKINSDSWKSGVFGRVYAGAAEPASTVE